MFIFPDACQEDFENYVFIYPNACQKVLMTWIPKKKAELMKLNMLMNFELCKKIANEKAEGFEETHFAYENKQRIFDLHVLLYIFNNNKYRKMFKMFLFSVALNFKCPFIFERNCNFCKKTCVTSRILKGSSALPCTYIGHMIYFCHSPTHFMLE